MRKESWPPKVSKAIKNPGKSCVLIYGPNGIGKTWWASRLPNVLYWDYENGLNAQNGVEHFASPSYEFLEVICKEITNNPKYDTIVIDTVHNWMIQCLAEKARTAGQDKDVLFDLNKPSTCNYGAEKRGWIIMLSQVMAMLKATGKGIILVANETISTIKKRGEEPINKVEPFCLNPDAMAVLKSHADFIFRVSSEDIQGPTGMIEERYVHTSDGVNGSAKSKYPMPSKVKLKNLSKEMFKAMNPDDKKTDKLESTVPDTAKPV